MKFYFISFFVACAHLIQPVFAFEFKSNDQAMERLLFPLGLAALHQTAHFVGAIIGTQPSDNGGGGGDGSVVRPDPEPQSGIVPINGTEPSRRRRLFQIDLDAPSVDTPVAYTLSSDEENETDVVVELNSDFGWSTVPLDNLIPENELSSQTYHSPEIIDDDCNDFIQ